MRTLDLPDFEQRFSTYLTHRVAMRPLAMSDAWPMWLATRNPEFNRYLLWGRPSNVGQVTERLARIGDERRIGAMAANSGVLRATGEWVGAVRVYQIEPPPGVRGLAVECGLWAHPKFWRKGLAAELTRLIVGATFAELDVEMIRACASIENRAAHSVLQASGFGPRRESLVEKEDGTPSPTLEFELLRSEHRRWYDQAAMQESMEFAHEPEMVSRVAA